MTNLEGQSVIRVMPPVYEVAIGFWRWCKLDEVCELVPYIARLGKSEYSPTPEKLVRDFAGVVRLNRIPENITPEAREKRKKKIFRYVLPGGTNLGGTEVPLCERGHNWRAAPPYSDFKLDLSIPYPKGLFVPEGWVLDTMSIIRRGAVYAIDHGNHLTCAYPENRPGEGGGFIIRDKRDQGAMSPR